MEESYAVFLFSSQDHQFRLPLEVSLLVAHLILGNGTIRTHFDISRVFLVNLDLYYYNEKHQTRNNRNFLC